MECVISMWVFFFFKQKTAYEIGTGDWSSDVCSSDLRHCSEQNYGFGAEQRSDLNSMHPTATHKLHMGATGRYIFDNQP